MKVKIDCDEMYPIFEIINDDHPYASSSVTVDLTDDEWRQVVYAMEGFRIAQQTLGKAYYKTLEEN